MPLSDEEMRKVLQPDPSEEQILRILQKCYCPNGETTSIVKRLDSYDDCNFKVQINQTNYLLKVHNGVESRDFIACLKESSQDYGFYCPENMKSVIHLQNAIMELCCEHNIPTSQPIRPPPPPTDEAFTGRKVSSIKEQPIRVSPVIVEELPVLSASHSPCPLAVRLLSWTEGIPMNTAPCVKINDLASAGRFLGELNHVLDRLNIKHLTSTLVSDSRRANSDNLGTIATLDVSLLTPAQRYHQWDGKNTSDLRNFVEYIHDHRRRSLVLSVIDAFEVEIKRSHAEDSFRIGVIHGDFNDANVLMNKTGIGKISGVIDFGDSVESWRILDISVAMAYAMLSKYAKAERCSLSAAAATLRGYNAEYPLTNDEKKHLPLLMACRLACSVTLGAFSYAQNPNNKYLLLHAEPAWRALELIWPYDEHARNKIRLAAGCLFDNACLYDLSDDSSSKQSIMNNKKGDIGCSDLIIHDSNVVDELLPR